jgi:hypothetical protein
LPTEQPFESIGRVEEGLAADSAEPNHQIEKLNRPLRFATFPAWRSAMRGLGAFGPLLGLAAILATFMSVYVILGEQPPESFLSLYGPLQFLFILYWTIIDAHHRQRVPCHDFGFLVGLFFPVSLAWYVMWTRGIKGLVTLGVLGALFVLPFFCATVVGVLKLFLVS